MTVSSRYSAIAIALHWAIALGIIGMIALGWNMDGNESLYQLHKSIGITILVLTIARIVWRVMNPPPPLPDDMKPLEKTASHLVHWAFYGLMLAMPLTGWLLVSTSHDFDIPTVIFGLVSWPDIPGVSFLANETGHAIVEFFHSKLAWVAIVLLGLHVAGAVKHEISAEEGVLKRMLPGLFGKTDKPSPPPRGFLAAFGAAIGFFALIAFVPMLFTGGSGASTTTSETPANMSSNWTVDPAQSGIYFSGIHDGSEYEGAFGDWNANIRFDPEQLADARAVITVRTGSVTASKKLYTDSLKSAEWFNVSGFPTATATLENFQKTGDGRYSADLTLAIKDSSVTVPFTFELDIDGNEARMKGEATVQRTPLNLGQTSDPTADWVGENVLIDVEVLASRKS
ncbi:cytochrome b/b6 domain-containing protein [Henriciella pelagia]|uniref:Cytochrome b561 n=1 Tax=Henriciella pelagia TaxID=1977912 RepID=A0ABQ1JVJ8_9PROT|nr:cytochrome b/b6 domain-containing protein [Henriciella pelagia]GGB79136.1 cytochrome b561 [Henriciella pelagia]